MSSHAHDIITAGAKVAPAVGVVAADTAMRQLWGISFQDWVYILTAVYLVFQIVVIMPRLAQAVKTGWRTVMEWFSDAS